MKHLFLIVIVILAFALASALAGSGGAAYPRASAQASPQSALTSSQAIPPLQENARQARVLLDKAILALGGQAFLSMRGLEQEDAPTHFFTGAQPATAWSSGDSSNILTRNGSRSRKKG